MAVSNQRAVVGFVIRIQTCVAVSFQCEAVGDEIVVFQMSAVCVAVDCAILVTHCNTL